MIMENHQKKVFNDYKVNILIDTGLIAYNYYNHEHLIFRPLIKTL